MVILTLNILPPSSPTSLASIVAVAVVLPAGTGGALIVTAVVVVLEYPVPGTETSIANIPPTTSVVTLAFTMACLSSILTAPDKKSPLCVSVILLIGPLISAVASAIIPLVGKSIATVGGV